MASDDRQAQDPVPDMLPPAPLAEERAEEESRRRFLAPAMALIALLVFAAAVWFSYSMGRSARTDAVVPVIEADAGAVKHRPDKPGGIDPPHQDKLVFDRVAPGQSGKIAERLRPEPEEPLEEATTIPPEEQQPAAGAAPAQTADAADAEPPASGPPPVWAEASVPDQPQYSGRPAEPEQEQPAAATAVQPAAEQPASTAPAAEQAKPAVPAQPEQEAALPPGGYRVQLASLRSEDGAKKAWTRLSAAYADLLGPARHFVERADLGEGRGTYYRLQVGPFPDKSAAAALCAALRDRAASCIVVKGR